jgi:TolB-like protein/Tfp pilus assembly protein PilF
LVDTLLGHYEILEKIGEGGMGVVYRAHDERLDRDVALKVLRPGLLADDAARKRFRKEALALAKLNHPNIESVYDFDTQDATDFLVMEYIPGQTLSEKLSAGSLPEKEIAQLGVQMAEGLAAAHARGLVHRDLKPANLRMTPDGQLKILDFGLAKLVRPSSDSALTQSLSETRGAAGTLPYMAPEQLQGGEVDARTDIFAAGTVLYEMATGRMPFQEKLSTALADAIVHRPTPPPGRLRPELSRRLEETILKCLEKERESRYQSARELLVDLRRLSAPAAEISPRREARGRAWSWRRTALAAGSAVVVLLAVLYALNVGGVREWVAGRGGAARINSLAVLPLENLSRDPEQDYFVDGMTEALIADLSKISALRVISRTSVMQYKEKRKSLPEIARELKVDAVVEGSVLRVGDRVRITAQLVRAVPEQHLWANSYDRDLRDILALHSDVARAIANEVQAKLTPQEQTRQAVPRSVNPEAYVAYLKGRYYWHKRTEEGMRKAVEHFERAIDLDPGYAMAYAGLADSYNLFSLYAGVAPKEAFPRGKAAAVKALEMDGTLAEAHTSLAWAMLAYDWDWSGAEEEFRRAMELNPSYEVGHLWYGLQLIWCGKSDQGLAEVKRAQELAPVSVEIDGLAGVSFYLARQYDGAIEQLKKAQDLDRDYAGAHVVLGLTYVQRRMYREAIAELERGVESSGQRSIPLGRLGYGYAMAGQRRQALAVLGRLKEQSKRKYVPASDFAIVYVGLGEKAQAFSWLQKAYEERATELVFLKADPRFDPLRSDPRFQDLIRRMNFPP